MLTENTNQTEIEEKQYLTEVIVKINQAIHKASEQVNHHFKEALENKVYLAENKDGMDHVEKINVRQTIDNIGLVGENAAGKRSRLSRLLRIPYFGRINFRQKGNEKTEVIYVGVHSLFDEAESKNIIYDWRAPVSAMFYDFELGDAWYESPTGKTDASILLKRQYRIRNGIMEYMLESSLNIHDDVLQKELSQASSDKMRNIVATIQREQNEIIRNEDAKILIIQGVAGSGKTSIALHRIAYLLYRFKDTLRSEDILIISPNNVFANYISNVLPELGEEKVEETSMESLANRLFLEKIRFQTFFEQVAVLLENNDKKFIERIQFKSSIGFIKQLAEYLLFLENQGFVATDIRVKKYLVPSWFILERFKAHGRWPIFIRHNEIVRDVVNNIFKFYKYEVETKERSEIRNAVIKMFISYNIQILYKKFFEWLGRPEMFKMKKGSTYEYADVYPMLYIKIRLEGLKPFTKVKHLVIDEMQDYTPIQYKVLSVLFHCNKTVLGDINQSVNPYCSSDQDIIQSLLGQAAAMTMNTSYRSTFEITNFTKKIGQKKNVTAIERHGEQPGIYNFNKQEDEISYLQQRLAAFTESGYNSLGIICKTQTQAVLLFEKLKLVHPRVTLITASSSAFSSGAIITTAHQAKGLEFDEVVVPFCDQKNYQTEPDKQMLYVACTRAMHRLDVTHCGKPSLLIA